MILDTQILSIFYILNNYEYFEYFVRCQTEFLNFYFYSKYSTKFSKNYTKFKKHLFTVILIFYFLSSIFWVHRVIFQVLLKIILPGILPDIIVTILHF